MKLTELPAIGSALANGIYAGLIMQTDGLHALIDTGEVLPEEMAYGARGVDVATNTTDSQANTLAMAEAGSEAAKIAIERGASIPARDALELLYRHFKPTNQKNACAFRDGDNPGSIPPGFPYTTDSPVKTTHGGKPFLPTWYLSSTQGAAHSAYVQDFDNGGQSSFYESYEARVRLVRTFPVTQ